MKRILPLLLLSVLLLPAYTQGVTVYRDTTICGGDSVLLYASTPILNTTTYSVNSIGYTPYSYSTGTTVTLSDDAISASIPIGFNFCFFGTTYSNFYIGSNGWIAFSTQPTTFTSVTIPNTGASVPKNCIMGPWQDWHPGIAGGPYIRYQMYGTSPYRVMVISWNNCPMFSCTSTLGTFQICIYETTNIIENYLADKPNCIAWAGGTAVQGIHNSAGTVAYTVAGRNSTQWTATNEGWSYVPTGPAFLWNWYVLGSATSFSSNDSVVVGPTTTTSYYVRYSACGSTPKDTITVTVSGTSVNPNAGPDTTICGDSFYLPGNPPSPATGRWTCNNPSVVISDDTLYNSLATNLSIGANVFYWTITGCGISTDTLVVNKSSPPIVVLDSTNFTYCSSDTSGFAHVSVSGAVTPYSYQWSNGSVLEDLNNTVAGNYSLTVADSVGCESVITCFIPVQDSIEILSTTENDVDCNGNNNGLIDVLVSGGALPLSYSLNAGPSQPTSLFSSLAPNAYTYLITDAHGCTESLSFTITEPALLNLNLTSFTGIHCLGDSSGLIDVSCTGGTTPYSYTINSIPASPPFSGLPAASYTIEVSDDSGCTDNLFLNLTAPTALTIALDSIHNVNCFGGNNGVIDVTASGGTGPYTYSWSSGAALEIASGLIAGSYTLTVSDDSGCIKLDSFVVTEPSLLSLTVSGTNSSCFGANNGTATASVSGGTAPYTYLWNDPMAQTTATASALGIGSYTVTVTDAKGCTASGSYTVTEPSLLNLSLTDYRGIACNGDSSAVIHTSVSGGVPSYSYTINGVVDVPPFDNLPAAAYTIIVTDDSGCTDNLFFNVTQPLALTAVLDSAHMVNCFGGSNGVLDVSGNGGVAPYSYSWAIGGSSDLLSGLSAGSYVVTVTDDSACSAVGTFVITQPALLTVGMSGVNVSCFGMNNGTATATPAGGTLPYTYLWDDPSGQTTATAGSLSPGTYHVTVTDSKGCSATGTYTITEPPLIVFGYTSVDPTCHNGSNGSITAIPLSVGSFTYNLNGGAFVAGPSFSGLAAGTHTLTIRDGFGCTQDTLINLNNPARIAPSVSVLQNVSCFGGSDAMITVSTTAGIPSFNYSVIGQTSFSPVLPISGLNAGTHTLLVRDAAGCLDSTNFTISEPPALVLNVTATDPLCYNDSTGDISLVIVGGTPTYETSINGSPYAAVSSYNGLWAGVYVINVRDDSGCVVGQNVLLQNPAIFIINAISTPVNCAGQSDGTVTIIPNGGTTPYMQYGISSVPSGYSMQTSTVFSGLASGSYYLIGYDANGCEADNSIIVGSNDPDTFSLVIDSTSCYGSEYSDGSIEVFANPNAPYVFSVNDSNYTTANIFDDLAADDYILYAKNVHGCVTALPFTIYEPPPIFVDIIPDSSFISLGGSAALTVVYSNVNNPNWVWQQTDGLDCPDCPHPTISTYQTGVYELRLYKPGSDYCYGEAFTWVIVDTAERMYVPNAFTPNGDGVNDIFLPISNDVADYDIQIYNRWGEMLFESNNLLYGWDGYYKGVLMKPGVYIYTIQYHNLAKEWIKKQGSVTLIR